MRLGDDSQATATEANRLEAVVSTRISRGRDVVVRVPADEIRRRAAGKTFLDVPVGNRGARTLLLAETPEELKQYRGIFDLPEKNGGVVVLGDTKDLRRETKELQREPGRVAGTSRRVIDHIRRGVLNTQRVIRIVVDLPEDPSAGGYDKDVAWIIAKTSRRRRIAVYRTSDLFPESLIASLRRREDIDERVEKESVIVPTSKDQMRSALEELVRQVRVTADTDELDMYRRLFRRTVPWNLRSWVSAWLLRQTMESGRTKLAGGTNIFVGIGKNRRVFPRDIIHIFTTEGGVSRADIGEIKILENYSFVTVAEDKARQIIDRVDGLDFRGRRIAVNYARKKENDG